MISIHQRFRLCFGDNRARIGSVICVCVLFISSCVSAPLSKKIDVERPLCLGIIGFKITAPIKHLSSIVETTEKTKKLDKNCERILLTKQLDSIESLADKTFEDDFNKIRIIPVRIPAGFAGVKRGEKPTPQQVNEIRKKFKVDAILYGQISQYGEARLLYPILGETLDILGESVIVEIATHSNELILANIGFELITSTPLWFGGAYIFGWAFRPVTVEAKVIDASSGKEIWNKTVDKIVDRDILKTYPKPDQAKKEIQLEASLISAMKDLADSIQGPAKAEQ